MKLDDWGDGYVLSSGRRFYANRGLLSISPAMEMGEGYDGGVDDIEWSPAERREVAEFMIALWRQFGDQDGVKREASDDPDMERG
jgi:hypothetical protein